MSFEPEDVLAALEEARQVVRAMPPAEITHSLRMIRGSSSRRLTPVEKRTLFRELDRDESFRQATLEHWGPPPPDQADSRTAASVLFLQRTEDWEMAARGHLQVVELEGARREIVGLKKRQEEMQSEARDLKDQITDLHRKNKEASQRRAKGLSRDRARARERIADLERRIAEEKKESERLSKELESSFDELTKVDERYAYLRKRYQSRAESAVNGGSSNVGNIGFSRDPLHAARMLDQMVSFWEVGSDLASSAPPPKVRLELPPGIDPRSGRAVRWLFFEAPRSVVVVDGWNVAYNWQYHNDLSEDPDQGIVELVTNKLANLARYSVGGHRVSFYLDSRYAHGIDPDWQNRFQSGRLTGYYVADADDAIAKEVAERTGAPVVVITSDKELTERCQVHGALVLASESLAEWMAESPV